MSIEISTVSTRLRLTVSTTALSRAILVSVWYCVLVRPQWEAKSAESKTPSKELPLRCDEANPPEDSPFSWTRKLALVRSR
jgi:hypothetical protein